MQEKIINVRILNESSDLGEKILRLGLGGHTGMSLLRNATLTLTDEKVEVKYIDDLGGTFTAGSMLQHDLHKIRLKKSAISPRTQLIKPAVSGAIFGAILAFVIFRQDGSLRGVVDNILLSISLVLFSTALFVVINLANVARSRLAVVSFDSVVGKSLEVAIEDKETDYLIGLLSQIRATAEKITIDELKDAHLNDAKRRIPLIALLLTLLTPGLGQLYNGQLYKAFTFYLGVLVLLLTIVFGGFLSSFKGMLVSFAMVTAIVMGALFDSVSSAIKLKNIKINKYNRWYIYCIMISISLLIVNPSLRHFVPYKALKMPANSMSPTLLVGDHFLLDEEYYQKLGPKMGDIVAFAYPADQAKLMIKRVVGVQGDKIEMRDKVLLVNDQIQNEGYINHSDSKILPASLSPRDNFGPLNIPPNGLFVMGDNRDDSLDSRFWKSIDVSTLKGKVSYVYWSKYKERIGLEIK